MDSKVLDLANVPYLFLAYSKPLLPGTALDFAAFVVILGLSALYLLWGILWDRTDPHHCVLFERPQQNGNFQSPRRQATRNIAQKLEESDKDCVVFWGSQSGTSEAFASRLAKECESRFSLTTISADLSDYDAGTIGLVPRTKTVVFILSTYGEGDPSDNASSFWEWIVKDSSDVPLNNLHYTAFGLGNSNYKHYNRIVDVVVERLDQRGAQRIAAVGKADDATRSTQEEFMAWKDGFFAALKSRLGLKEQAVQYQATLSAVQDESLEPTNLFHGDPSGLQSDVKVSSKNSSIRPLGVTAARELFQEGSRNCVHMELDIAEHSELGYKTGDHLGVWPTNPEEEVSNLLRSLGQQTRGDIPILLRTLRADVALKIPTPATLKTLFRFYLEICAPVSRDTMLGLAQFAPTADAKAMVTQLSQDRGRYQALVAHTQLTLGRLLLLASPELAWVDLPLSWVIEALPSIQPRYYSISSSSVLSPHRIAITALVTADRLPMVCPGKKAAVVNGVTTNYLHTLSQAKFTRDSNTNAPRRMAYHLPPNQMAHIYAHVRRSKFKLPIAKATPIIMVAAGTGLAPFRAFISERAKVAASAEIGAMRLFFGCRSPSEDYIYRDELERTQEKLIADGTGDLKIVTAYSRSDKPKMYVQDRVTEYIRDVLQLLDCGASLYICGRTLMAKEVGRRVVEGVRGYRGWDQAGAEEWLERLKRQGKWREDVWG